MAALAMTHFSGPKGSSHPWGMGCGNAQRSVLIMTLPLMELN